MNPKQSLFLLLQNRDAFYGGAGGGGKSWALLAGALQYVDIPGYNAILFRKTLTDLQQPESLMSRSHEWLDSTDASWDNELYRWTFPSGATLSFGYINHDKDKLKYQGAAYQYCVAAHTLIKTPNGLKEIQTLRPGSYVTTLEGSRKVLKVIKVGVKPTFTVKTPYSTSEISQSHPILSEHDWADPREQIAIQSRTNDRLIVKSTGLSPSLTLPYEWTRLDLQPTLSLVDTQLPANLLPVSGVSLEDDRNDFATSDDEHLEIQPLPESFDRSKQSEPSLQLMEQVHAPSFLPSVLGHAHACSLVGDSQCGCPTEYGFCDELFHLDLATLEQNIQTPTYVGEQIRLRLHVDDRKHIHSHTPISPEQYFHPYTNEPHTATETSVYADTEIVQEGEAEVWDLTVEGVSHYILSSGIIARNCGFDELTQFEEKPVLYLFSRMRRLMGYPVPIRFRAAANPGGPGHDWVKARYIDQDWKKTGRIFIPATLYDNAFIDQDEYKLSLDNLDPLTKAQILNGDWEVRPDTLYFTREMLKVVNSVPEYMYHQERKRFVRFWDLASTERSLKNKDPDYTCGVLMMEAGGQFLIIDVQRFRRSPSEVEARIRTTAIEDRENYGSVSIYIEEEPGASGVSSVDHYIRNVLKGFIVEPFKTGGRNKQKRARPFASAAKNGNVFLMKNEWNPEFIKELEVFPQEAASIHDDQVDAASGAHHCLVNLMITGRTLSNYDPAYLPNSLTSATPTQVRDEVQKRFHKPQQRFWSGAGRFHQR